MKVLVENLRSALKERIEALPWMGAETKKAAQAKLAAFGVKIGYPDKWIDYSALPVSRASYFDNVRAARAFDIQRDIDKLGKPIDRTEWGMTPPTVNAYYNPTMNEIVFPAGILQPPFFYADADDAVNYGGIGVVIGHEMSHGFDDSGSRYDAAGNLKNWWTDADRKAYESRTDLMVKEFDGFKALPDQSVNGKLTLGENIGDLGGLKIAWAALAKALGKDPNAAAPIDGFTPGQRFFLSLRDHLAGQRARRGAPCPPQHRPAQPRPLPRHRPPLEPPRVLRRLRLRRRLRDEAPGGRAPEHLVAGLNAAASRKTTTGRPRGRPVSVPGSAPGVRRKGRGSPCLGRRAGWRPCTPRCGRRPRARTPSRRPRGTTRP